MEVYHLFLLSFPTLEKAEVVKLFHYGATFTYMVNI